MPPFNIGWRPWGRIAIGWWGRQWRSWEIGTRTIFKPWGRVTGWRCQGWGRICRSWSQRQKSRIQRQRWPQISKSQQKGEDLSGLRGSNRKEEKKSVPMTVDWVVGTGKLSPPPRRAWNNAEVRDEGGGGGGVGGVAPRYVKPGGVDEGGRGNGDSQGKGSASYQKGVIQKEYDGQV